MWKLAAYSVLFVHLVFSLAMLLMPFAIILNWDWTHIKAIRNLHIFLLAFVSAEVTISYPCPLMTWENTFRKKAHMPLYTAGFFDYWVEKICKVPLNNFVFNLFFLALALLSFAQYFIYPPR